MMGVSFPCQIVPRPVLLFFAFKFSQESRMLQKALVLVFVVVCIAGCIGCSTSSHYVYATLSAANEVAAYREDPYSGTLTQLSGSPYTVGDGAISLVLHPSGKFLYVLNPGQGEDDISLFDVQSNGTLIEVSPRTPLGTAASLPKLLVIDPSGSYLYVMNTGSDNISVFSIDSSSGALMQVPNSPFLTGPLQLNMRLTPSGNLLYVSFASETNGLIACYSVNAGQLSLLFTTTADGISPLGMAIDPSGTHLYVGNIGPNSSISVYTIGASGALAKVNGSPLDDIYSNPYALILDPKGQYLYVANQGSNNVAVYSISSSTGLPVALTTSTSTFAFATESSPSFLAEDPNGNYLFVGNQGSSAGIQAFGINSGNLNPLHTYGVGNTPSSIAVLQ
jgi:6-phosphogluconolactonase